MHVVDRDHYQVVYAPWKAIQKFKLPEDQLIELPGACVQSLVAEDVDGAQKAANDVLGIIRNIEPFPRQARKRIRSESKVEAFVLGKAHMFGAPDANRKRKRVFQDTKATAQYAQLWQALKTLMKSVDPNASFTSVQVNKCTNICNLHVDRRNFGPSYLLVLGSYTAGGDLQVLDMRVDVHNKVVSFNGQIPHRALPHHGGDRYSFVFFTAGATEGSVQSRDPNVDLLSVCRDPRELRLTQYTWIKT